MKFRLNHHTSTWSIFLLRAPTIFTLVVRYLQFTKTLPISVPFPGYPICWHILS